MRRVGFMTLLASVTLLGLTPAGVSAAPVMTFGLEYDQLMLRSNCISGRGPANAAARVIWKSQSGNFKAIVDLPTNPAGAWGYCSASRQLRVGDTIRASSGSYARTFTMPNVTLNSNRVTERFSGIGLPGATGQLWFMSGIFADFAENEEVTANGQGVWTSTPGGATGGIEASVDWVTAQGDFIEARGMVAQVAVTIGRAAVEGGWNGLSEVTVMLRDPATNAQRGRAIATTSDFGQFNGRFEDASGEPVNVRVGDRIVSPIASNLDWHVPAINGTANVATNFVNGHCSSTEIEPIFAMVRVFRTGANRGVAIADTDSNGDFEADFNGTPAPFYDPANIKHGDRILINCYYDTYDVVGFVFRVP